MKTKKRIRTLAAVLSVLAAFQSVSLVSSAHYDITYAPRDNMYVKENPLLYKSDSAILNNYMFYINCATKNNKTYFYDTKRDIMIADGNNNPVDINSNEGQRYAADYTLMMKNAAAAWDFYNSLGWRGFSNTEKPIYLRLNTSTSFGRSSATNASADVDTITVGIGDKYDTARTGSRYLTQNWATDVEAMTHEYTHLVTMYKLGWDGAMKGETAALMEAYSDIMGELNDPNIDWKISTDMYDANIQSNSTYYSLRDIANPSNTHTPYIENNQVKTMNNNFYTDYDKLRAAFYDSNGNLYSDLENRIQKGQSSNRGSAQAGAMVISHVAYLMNQRGIPVSDMKLIWYNSMDKIKDSTEETRFATFSDCRKAVVASLEYCFDNNTRSRYLNIINQAFDEAKIYIRGDANDDGYVDAKDLETIRSYVNGNTGILNSTRKKKSADVNYDGRIDSKDVDALKKQLYTTMTQRKLMTMNEFTYLEGNKLRGGKYWVALKHSPNTPDSFLEFNNDMTKSSYVTLNTTFYGDYVDYCNVAYEEPYYECAGFAKKLQYDFFGTRKYLQLSGIDYTPQVGDHLRISNNYHGFYSEHSVFVMSVNGNTITYADCNSGEYCRINWNKTMTINRDSNGKIASFNLDGATYQFEWVERPMKLGDVNGDSMVDAQDVSAIQRVINGTYSNNYRNARYRSYAADMNCDGYVNSADYSLLVNYVYGFTTADYGYLK